MVSRLGDLADHRRHAKGAEHAVPETSEWARLNRYPRLVTSDQHQRTATRVELVLAAKVLIAERECVYLLIDRSISVMGDAPQGAFRRLPGSAGCAVEGSLAP